MTTPQSLPNNASLSLPATGSAGLTPKAGPCSPAPALGAFSENIPARMAVVVLTARLENEEHDMKALTNAGFTLAEAIAYRSETMACANETVDRLNAFISTLTHAATSMDQTSQSIATRQKAMQLREAGE